MQNIYKRVGIVSGAIILALYLAANAWFILHRLELQTADHAFLVQTDDVIQDLTEIQLLVDDAETGQRGFLYTGRPEYLAPYRLAAATMDSHLQKLSSLVAAEPDKQSRVAQLATLSHAKLDELEQTIALYSAGKPEQARALVLSNRGKYLMEQIRELIGAMEQDELRLEHERTSAYARGIGFTRAAIAVATVLAIGGLAFLVSYILRQMAMRERSSHDLRVREEQYRVTLNSIGDGVIATDGNGTVTFINPVAERLTGHRFASAQGKSMLDVFPIFNENTGEPVINPVEKVMEHGQIVGLANHTVLKHRDGQLVPIEDSAAPIRDDQGRLIGVVLVFRDATQERQTQEIARRAEKLAAAARVASTVAHEINNPLEAVGNLIYLTKLVPEMPATALEYIQAAEEQLLRVGHIAKQTLAFYRESKKWEPLNLRDLVDSALRLYSNKLEAKDISVDKHYQRCPILQGSPGELKQVIANLISNAADAVSANGRISIGISPVTLDGSAAHGVELRVEDDGPGIAEQNLQRIFEPFFTTKQDVGTGLGLWVSKEIIERHEGTITAASRQPGGLPGARFTVRLPVAVPIVDSLS